MDAACAIKREPNLVILSREHHDGLLLVWKIKQGIKLKVSRARIKAYVIDRFDKEIEPHFVEEEKLLFDKLPSADELRLKAEAQHTALRNLVSTLRLSVIATEDHLLNFALLLEEHIRFEERTFFPYFEQVTPKYVLEEIGKELEVHSATKECYVWDDEFWKP